MSASPVARRSAHQATSGLDVRALQFAYGGAAVLSDIDLHVAEGEFLCLLGPSGCGKTTLLRLLAGLDLPAAGSISYNGSPILGPSIERGVVFQNYSLFPWFTLAGNIELALSKSHPQHDAAWRHAHAKDYLVRWAGRVGRTVSFTALRRNAATRCYRSRPRLGLARAADG